MMMTVTATLFGLNEKATESVTQYPSVSITIIFVQPFKSDLIKKSNLLKKFHFEYPCIMEYFRKGKIFKPAFDVIPNILQITHRSHKQRFEFEEHLSD